LQRPLIVPKPTGPAGIEALEPVAAVVDAVWLVLWAEAAGAVLAGAVGVVVASVADAVVTVGAAARWETAA
jgi:hypothetical protein